MLKNFLERVLPKILLVEIRNLKNYFGNFSFQSYSQEGEDMILRRFFEEKQTGFYIDVGAHHPKRFSNTYFFYKKGWQGINIDAMPGSMEIFKKLRSRDINIEKPVSDCRQILTYYAFNEPALNGFSKELTVERNGLGGYKIIFEEELETAPLSEILDKYLPVDQTIDFMSIDVEGLDFKVLKSNDWAKYTPKIVLVEILGSSLNELETSEIASFLKQFGYCIYAKCVNTVFFKLVN